MEKMQGFPSHGASSEPMRPKSFSVHPTAPDTLSKPCEEMRDYSHSNEMLEVLMMIPVLVAAMMTAIN